LSLFPSLFGRPMVRWQVLGLPETVRRIRRWAPCRFQEGTLAIYTGQYSQGPRGMRLFYAKPRPHRVEYGAEGRSGSNWRSEPGIVGSRGRSRSGFPAPRGSERASKNYHCKALSPFSEISRVHGICVCTVQSCPRLRMRKQFWTGVIVYPPFPKPYDVQGTIRSEIGILILPSAMAAEFERCALKARLYYRLLNLYKCRSVVIVLIPVRTVELPV
jgi:hypothetical protein